jgi:uncharacterized membrane protein
MTLTRAQRAADVVTEFCGSWPFIVWGALLVGGWIVINTCWAIWGAFDPYPFMLGNLALTIISTFQSPLIMMSQNRQMERDREAVQGLHAKLDELKAILNDLALDEAYWMARRAQDNIKELKGPPSREGRNV